MKFSNAQYRDNTIINIIFVIQICNEWKVESFVPGTNVILFGTLISMGDISMSVAVI